MTTPGGAPAPVRGVVAVDLDDFAVRPVPTPPLHRPIDVGLRPGEDDVAYILDFGQFEMTGQGVDATPGTGRILRHRLRETTS